MIFIFKRSTKFIGSYEPQKSTEMEPIETYLMMIADHFEQPQPEFTLAASQETILQATDRIGSNQPWSTSTIFPQNCVLRFFSCWLSLVESNYRLYCQLRAKQYFG